MNVPRVPLRILFLVSITIGLTMALSSPARAQSLQRPAPWEAQWIGYPGSSGTDYEVLFLRKSIELENVPESLPVHVSADNRYRLFVNGVSVSKGPARGDLDHWRYETVDLAPHLRTGENVVAAIVWNYAELRPVAQITRRTGFVLQGAVPAAEMLNTDDTWQVRRSDAHSPIPVNRAALNYTYIVVGPGERLDGSKFPWGWNERGAGGDATDESETGTDGEAAGESDASWVAADELELAYPRGSAPYGASVTWQLIPREIPPMEERPVRLDRIARIEEAPSPFATSEGFLQGTEDLVVPTHSRVVLLLDHAHLTTAYPVLRTSGGEGARVRLVYAEALFDEDGDKGNRDVIEGKKIRGIEDEFILEGGNGREYSTLWWRTWRYVELMVETADSPVRIHDLYGVFTAYPFEEQGSFSADAEEIDDIWEIGWRTARLCAGETYFDCPYYEQLQYVGDTRIQALISLFVAGDDRLMRKAILDFDYSRIASGLTASRHPSADEQFIPPYSLFWIAMIHDFWMHREDAAFVEDKLTGVRGVLDWYARYVDETGMLGPMPWWNFVDWSYERSGIPPGADDGHSTVIALQYAYALDMAEEMSRAFGREDEADEYAARSGAIKEAVRRLTWDSDRQFFADTPSGSFFTEHTNVMAVLVDVVPVADQRAFIERVLAAEDLLPTGFYYRFYLHRAVQKAGLSDRYMELLQPWRDMLALGLTTFAENPGRTRSDAHAWSATPNFDFLSMVAGINADAPGFSRVRIAPALGSLSRLRGVVPHPAGEIVVELARSGASGIEGSVTLPDGLGGVFEWNGKRVDLHGGAQRVTL